MATRSRATRAQAARSQWHKAYNQGNLLAVLKMEELAAKREARSYAVAVVSVWTMFALAAGIWSHLAVQLLP